MKTNINIKIRKIFFYSIIGYNLRQPKIAYLLVQSDLNIWKIDVLQLALKLKYVQPFNFWLENLNLV